MQQLWGTSVPLIHRSKPNVSFNEDDAVVEYPETLSGWNIVSDCVECTVSLTTSFGVPSLRSVSLHVAISGRCGYCKSSSSVSV